jgi:hypothetical protein
MAPVTEKTNSSNLIETMIAERFKIIYNASKHQIVGHEIPAWFTNKGIACDDRPKFSKAY